ncbi:MAG: hypothetical protein V9F01_04810 [Chitinophagaceae bacterium]
MKQKIILTALPNGIAKKAGTGNTVNASVALSLQVEDVNTTLQNVPDMLNWAEKVKTGKFIVYVNGTAVQAKVVSKEVDVALWKNLFASTVKVRSFVQEDLSDRPVLSYPVKHIISFVKDVITSMGNQFAEDLPDSNYYTDSTTFKSISDYTLIPYPKRGREKFKLENIVSRIPTDRRINELLRKNKAIPFSPSASPTFDFAQLKNFHGLYSKTEVKNYTPVQKPDFEFHDILSIIASYPQLMRKLGLVFDLEFSLPALMLNNIEPTIRIAFSGINFTTATTVSCPSTAFTKTAAGFYIKPSAGSLIEKGHLKLNTDAFTVFQVDTDGAGLKLCQMIDNLQLEKAKHIFYAVDNFIPSENLVPLFNNEAPTKEGLPVNRTSGIAVAKNGMAAATQQKFVRMNTLKPALVASGMAPAGLTGNDATFILPAEILYADDLNLGYRMDVQPEGGGGKWFSLHKRNNKYSFINSGNNYIDIPDMPADEGYIQIGAAEEDTSSGKQLKIGEAITRWDGWSLSVPPVGSALNEPTLEEEEIYDKSNPASKIKEANKYKAPLTQDFKLSVTPSVEKGTLPMLRFGKKYAIKIRTVDVAGNSVDHTFTPENAAQAVVPNIRYMRYEPADTPFLLLGNKMKDGESSEMMVIRSNENITVEEYEKTVAGNKYIPDAVRHVKPPRCTVERATTHGMLDKGFGEANAAQAASYYQKIIAEKDPLLKEEDNSPNLQIFSPDQQLLPVEYLADPMAAGVTLFISANDPNPKLPNPEVVTKRISFYFDEEATTAAQLNKTATTDEWFNPRTFRILLKEGAPSVSWEASSRTVKITLQKGVIFKMNYASFWRPDDIVKLSGILDMMGMNNLAGAVGKRIAGGQHWMFSPWRQITFVHAVQQPISVDASGKKYPAIVNIVPDRDYGDNFSWLNTQLLVHGPSTGQFDLDADWQDWIDDVNEPALQIVDVKAKVFHFTTLYLVFDYVFGDLNGIKNNPFKALKHTFNDTKHRFINYHSIATTRYREYFFNLIAEKGAAFALTREGEILKKVNILSSARPVAPQVEYVIPTFEWNRATTGKKTVTGRVSGLRVYLKRPWYSSGEGEQLAVVLMFPKVSDTIGGSAGATYTTWGTDPAKLSAPLPNAITPRHTDFVNLKPENTDMVAVAEHPSSKVAVAAFDVKYDEDRQLYYADIMFNMAMAYYPFVRLALAAYQKHSIRKNNTDCCLSPVVQPEYIQIPAPRASSVEFGASRTNVTVAISGSIAKMAQVPEYRSRVDFIIESLDIPASEETHISLDTKPIEIYQYVLKPADINNYLFLHSHQFQLPAAYSSKPFRIKVLEYELITYDPLKPNPNPGGANFGSMPLKERLVFADVYEVKTGFGISN